MKPHRFRNQIFVYAMWFGIFTGLIEGAEMVALKVLGWQTFRMLQHGIGIQMPAISAAFDLLLFLVIGIVLVALSRLLPQLPWVSVSILTFSFLMFVDYVAVVDRVGSIGLIAGSAGLATVVWRWFRNHQEAALAFSRRTVIPLAGVALVWGCATWGGQWLKERMELARLPAPPAGSPNVLVVVVDTLRADHLTPYGYTRDTSPNLKRLADEGVLFENAYAASSWTLPSHASIMTGRYPHEHGAETEHYDPKSPTLSRVLSKHGYRTGGFSANLLYFNRSHGFGLDFLHFEDYFQSVRDMAVRTVYGWEFCRFVVPRLGFKDDVDRRHAADINSAVLSWLDSYETHRPFFIFINYFDVHQPYLAPQPYGTRYLSNALGCENCGYDPDSYTHHPKFGQNKWQNTIDAYDGGISYVDHYFGELLNGLRSRGYGDNTVVIFTSDHGEMLGEHGFLGHRIGLYREELHIPLIVYWPNHVAAGIRINTPVSNVNLASTILDLVGARETGFRGPSLAELWKSPIKADSWPLPLSELAQFRYPGLQAEPQYSGAMKSIITSRYHYIYHEKLGPSLYDWKNDPEEMNDISHTDQGKVLASEYGDALQKLLADHPSTEDGYKVSSKTDARGYHQDERFLTAGETLLR